jgi:GNAT superfamily N-acetyltransferase
MELRALTSDLACLVRRDGVRDTVQRFTAGLSKGELLVLIKRLDDIAGVAFERRLALEDLGPDSLPALAEFNRRHCATRATARFAADLEHGHRGFVARQDGNVVGYYWWAERDHPHLDRLDVRLEDGDVYGFDFFLAPEHRGDGRAVECLHAVETRLRELGHDRLWGYVRGDNRPARWLYSMRGYEVVKHVRLRPGSMR